MEEKIVDLIADICDTDDVRDRRDEPGGVPGRRAAHGQRSLGRHLYPLDGARQDLRADQPAGCVSVCAQVELADVRHIAAAGP